MSFVRKLLATIVFLLAAWALFVYGAGEVQSDSLVDSKSAASTLEVAPQYLSTEALLSLASSNPSMVESKVIALDALSKDPANGAIAAFLLQLIVEGETSEDASDIADLAARLWPVHVYTHSRIADFWISQNRIDKLIPELNILMIREGGWRRQLFPILEDLTLNTKRYELLEPYISAPPNWWDSFFRSASIQQPTQTVSDLFELRAASGVAISEIERSSFVKRLLKDKQWRSAFEQWQAGLDPSEAALLDNGLFDGGFESAEVGGEFGWNFRRGKTFSITPRNTYGTSGKKALQVSFRQGLNRVAFKHVSQRLLLATGRYQVSFKVRADALKNPKGLVWRVRCESNKGELLAEGKPMLGRHQWQQRSFSFSVPRGCEVQSLVLEAISKYPHELIFNGKLWLDDVAIDSVAGGA